MLLVATCSRCRTSTFVYDLKYYPAATKLPGEEIFSETEITMGEPRTIFVGYEYGELDPDQEFDPDDISWFQVFADVRGELVKVFEDETA